MRKISLLIILMIGIHLNVLSQVNNNLIVFSNVGEKFTLILNGEKQNLYPETKVRVTDLNLKVYKVTILFEDKTFKTHQTDLTFFSTNTECHFALNKHGSKKHTMDYVTETKIVEPEKVNTSVKEAPTPITQNTNTNTNTNTNNGNGDVAVKTKLGTIGVGSNGVKIGGKNVNVNVNDKTKTANSTVNVLGNEVSMNKSIKTGCSNPMASLDFAESKKSIVSQTTDSTKHMAALKIINENCMLTSQLKEIMVLFTKDLTRLHFAKDAYSRTSDLNNYNSLENTFVTEQGKKDLKDFVKSSK